MASIITQSILYWYKGTSRFSTLYSKDQIKSKEIRMIPKKRIFFDVTTLLNTFKQGCKFPKGIPAVEYHYAQFLLNQEIFSVTFIYWRAFRGACVINTREMSGLLYLCKKAWDGDQKSYLRLRNRLVYIRVILFLLGKLPLSNMHSSRYINKSYYISISYCRMDKYKELKRFLKKNNAYFIVMFHDFFPIICPEYCRDDIIKWFHTVFKCAAKLCKGVIVPSKQVYDDAVQLLPSTIFKKEIMHGTNKLHAYPQIITNKFSSISNNYFVCLGTIEPKKNHLLLLNIWKQMLTDLASDNVPHLVIIGARGWNNDNVFNMLDKCPAFSGYVHEFNELGNNELATLLEGSNGLLFPSFAEGFGLPLTEALLLNIPVICSDISVFHEIAGEAAIFLDPLDAVSWSREILRLSHTCECDREKKRISKLKHSFPPWDKQIKKALEWMVTL